MSLDWDYTTLAATYDDRADYDSELIKEVSYKHGLMEEEIVLDLGAGTGKLTKELIKQRNSVIASEPNYSMRTKGMENIKSEKCRWISSAAESIDLPDNYVSSVWFGSSFNVVNHDKMFLEYKRVTKIGSWITCLWNHRDLDDPIQKEVESIFKSSIDNYQYGSRRQDPTSIIENSKLFEKIESYASNFEVLMPVSSYVEAWKSHATLRRQCKDENHFISIIRAVSDLLSDKKSLKIPYTTRLWTERRKLEK